MSEALFLVDTNVVSELARRAPDPNVVAFIASKPRLLVSAILFHELAFGVECAPRDKKAGLTAFLSAMRERFGAAAASIDVVTAETAGRLRAFARAEGRVLTVADSLIAATAMKADATLVTRNIKDFVGLGLRLVDPFARHL